MKSSDEVYIIAYDLAAASEYAEALAVTEAHEYCVTVAKAARHYNHELWVARNDLTRVVAERAAKIAGRALDVARARWLAHETDASLLAYARAYSLYLLATE